MSLLTLRRKQRTWCLQKHLIIRFVLGTLWFKYACIICLVYSVTVRSEQTPPYSSQNLKSLDIQLSNSVFLKMYSFLEIPHFHWKKAWGKSRLWLSPFLRGVPGKCRRSPCSAALGREQSGGTVPRLSRCQGWSHSEPVGCSTGCPALGKKIKNLLLLETHSSAYLAMCIVFTKALEKSLNRGAQSYTSYKIEVTQQLIEIPCV